MLLRPCGQNVGFIAWVNRVATSRVHASVACRLRIQPSQHFALFYMAFVTVSAFHYTVHYAESELGNLNRAY